MEYAETVSRVIKTEAVIDKSRRVQTVCVLADRNEERHLRGFCPSVQSK